MRRLNLVDRCGARLKRLKRLERGKPRPVHEASLEGARVFLDTGTLEAFAADGASDLPPEPSGLEPVFERPRGGVPEGPRALCLSVTHACDLACRYCYVRQRHSTGTTSPQRSQSTQRTTEALDGSSSVNSVCSVVNDVAVRMSRETARRALELLRPPGPWRVGFFGGEPMLAWDVVREATALARERAVHVNAGGGAGGGVPVRFSITTNGTLVTEERAAFLAANGFSVILSLDGPRELHDEERVTPEGGGSFDRVLKGLRTLAAAGLAPRTTLRATFPLERPDLVRRLEFLNRLAEEGLARAVSVEPAWPTTKDECGGMKDEEGRPHPSAFRLPPFPQYMAAARWAAGRIEAGGRFRFHHLEKALERILLMKPAGTECGAGYGYLEVAPTGEIHACHKAAGGAIGTVTTSPRRHRDTEDDTATDGSGCVVPVDVSCRSPCLRASVVNDVAVGVSERLRAPWRENRWCVREACRRCWARSVCGGGCRAVALEQTGDITTPWPVACTLKRAQVEAALYIAATCTRGKLRRFLDARAGRPRRDRQRT